MTDKPKTHIGVGLYSLAETARIIGAHPETVRRWLVEASELVPRYFDPSEKLLTFVELIEVYFVNMFRREGVPLPVIKEVSKAAAKRLSSPYPFAVKRFDTDGRTVFATLIKEHKGEAQIEDLNRSQYVFKSI